MPVAFAGKFDGQNHQEQILVLHRGIKPVPFCWCGRSDSDELSGKPGFRVIMFVKFNFLTMGRNSLITALLNKMKQILSNFICHDSIKFTDNKRSRIHSSNQALYVLLSWMLLCPLLVRQRSLRRWSWPVHCLTEQIKPHLGWLKFWTVTRRERPTQTVGDLGGSWKDGWIFLVAVPGPLFCYVLLYLILCLSNQMLEL